VLLYKITGLLLEDRIGIYNGNELVIAKSFHISEVWVASLAELSDKGLI
jgi:hypothetical protein